MRRFFAKTRLRQTAGAKRRIFSWSKTANQHHPGNDECYAEQPVKIDGILYGDEDFEMVEQERDEHLARHYQPERERRAQTRESEDGDGDINSTERASRPRDGRHFAPLLPLRRLTSHEQVQRQRRRANDKRQERGVHGAFKCLADFGV